MPWLTIFDRYALTITLKPLLAGAIVGVMAPLCVRLMIFLDLALSRKSGMSTVFSLVIYWVPHYLGIALPLALYVGLLIGFERLARDNEIAAMQASGVGLHRMLRPILFLSALTCIVSFVVIGWVAPYTVFAYRALIHELRHSNTMLLAEGGIFMRHEGRTFLFENVSRSDNSFGKLFVFIQNDEESNGPRTITAQSGSIVADPDGDASNLELRDGIAVRLEDWPANAPSGAPPPARALAFDRLSTAMGSRGTSIGPSDRGVRRNREWTLPELWAGLDDPAAHARAGKWNLIGEFHYRLAKVYLAWLLPFLALPFAAVRNPRTRYLRFALAMITVVVMYQVITQAEFKARVHGTSPYLITWLPLLGFTIFTAWRYWRQCFVVRRSFFEIQAERLMTLVASLRRSSSPHGAR